jgi:hypothetical protein
MKLGMFQYDFRRLIAFPTSGSVQLPPQLPFSVDKK